ncbi:aminoglycoside phosphotransferase family protein [Leisingera sp. SS27]|uniref:phosphotransferase family protein n=1 Tax=Leisingera sp. SS27 TaxID=2979462 RepID=UPI00232B1813|nr:aminoglycoside phosphotransferase family protein [Leisingera sp. SS27]MDC0656445.1 aminoglycoside phosphotransferase family protein [Leisingera sp. SS27]
MLLFAEYDETLLQSHVEEFQAAAGVAGTFSVNCIHKARDPGRDQMVFALMHETGRTLVLKKDFQAGKSWIEREYRLFEKLQPHFGSSGKNRIVTPVYLAADKSFHITEFAEGRTATDILLTPSSPAQVNQVFRRAGAWLYRLHSFSPEEPENIWMQWVFDELEKTAADSSGMISQDHYGRYASQLLDQSRSLQGSPCPRVFSHGDFHSDNLILGSGNACGLDLAYAKHKPAIYDVADFLASDITTPAEPAEIGPGGVRRASTEFFFKTYRRPFSASILNFHLRARLLLKLAHCRAIEVEENPRARKRFDVLLARLESAFSQPLDG